MAKPSLLLHQHPVYQLVAPPLIGQSQQVPLGGRHGARLAQRVCGRASRFDTIVLANEPVIDRAHPQNPGPGVPFFVEMHYVAFTPACSHISAGPLTQEFHDRLSAALAEAAAQGIEVCPYADPSSFTTPCRLGIIPQEWHDQDHSVCTPAPAGCL
jgi:hypothetical protein